MGISEDLEELKQMKDLEKQVFIINLALKRSIINKEIEIKKKEVGTDGKA